MKQLLFSVAILFSFILPAAAQQKLKTAAMSVLFNSKGNVIVPLSITQLSAKLGARPATIADDVHGDNYAWTFDNGVTATTLGDSSHVIAITLEVKGPQVVPGMPYKLTLNKSTMTECKAAFKSAGVSDFGETGLQFKKDGIFTYLEFNAAGQLISISQSDIDFNTIG